MLRPYFSTAVLLTCLSFGVLNLSACRSEDPGATTATATTVASPTPKLSPAAAIGAKVFHDVSLSASGQMSCATCHAAANGHASPFGTAIALGGPKTDQPGTRLSPTLRYLRFNTAFSIQKGDTPETAAGVPTGGFTWDGRANSLAEQAKLPFLSANEMANPSIEALIAKLAATPYANEFKFVFGDGIFNTPAVAFERLVLSVERFQIEDPAFASFDSKFDAFTAGKVALSAAEERGLALFNSADKGNCAACHSSAKPEKGSTAPGALFTDFTYDALGVPRNASIPANANPAYFDQGLCGPARTDLKARVDLCGKFKVPTLRNVALRQRFFHNGQIDSLEQAVRFYVTRDTDPAAWYPKDAKGKPVAYNDLPSARRANVNKTEMPYHAKRGEPASLTEAEVQDVVAFLRTLNDGYVP